MSLGFALGFAATALTLTAFVMKSMLPLRAAALASNVLFIAYGRLMRDATAGRAGPPESIPA
jgi:hypothetical protein